MSSSRRLRAFLCRKRSRPIHSVI